MADLVGRALPHAEVIGLDDANAGAGVFSQVLRVHLRARADWVGRPRWLPPSVVAKLPAASANRQAAVASGAYRRETLAYRDILTTSSVRAPGCWLVEAGDDGAASFLLEDLVEHRFVDQAGGMAEADAAAVASALARLHAGWRGHPNLDRLAIRHSTAAHLPYLQLLAGLELLQARWGDRVDQAAVAAFTKLVGVHEEAVQAFGAAGPPTLCHGDPRAANLVFDSADRPVLFDWQQMAVQFGEADLAWLAATSLTVDDRRRYDRSLVEAYGGDFDDYRLGFVLPGLAVLLLAQRELDPAGEAMAAMSLNRIGTALADLEVAELVAA